MAQAETQTTKWFEGESQKCGHCGVTYAAVSRTEEGLKAAVEGAKKGLSRHQKDECIPLAMQWAKGSGRTRRGWRTRP